MMTKEDAAQLLDNSQYRKEGNRDLWKQMKEHRLVAVFGASDDLCELRGAIDDEFGTGDIPIGSNGIVFSLDELS